MTVESILLASNGIMLLAVIALIMLHVWTLRSQDKREEKYIQALLAKDLREYSKARVEVSNTKPIEDKPQDNPFIAEADQTDEEFFKRVSDISTQFDIS